MKTLKQLFAILVSILLLSCNVGINDDSLREIWDTSRSSVTVVKRIEFNEQKGYPFFLDVEKANLMKAKHGTEYFLYRKNGQKIRIVAVYKIFNEADKFYYYILENEDRNPVANVKLITDKKGRVTQAEVVDGG